MSLSPYHLACLPFFETTPEYRRWQELYLWLVVCLFKFNFLLILLVKPNITIIIFVRSFIFLMDQRKTLWLSLVSHLSNSNRLRFLTQFRVAALIFNFLLVLVFFKEACLPRLPFLQYILLSRKSANFMVIFLCKAIFLLKFAHFIPFFESEIELSDRCSRHEVQSN